MKSVRMLMFEEIQKNLPEIGEYCDKAMIVGVNPLPGLRHKYPQDEGITIMSHCAWNHQASATDVLLVAELFDGRCDSLHLYEGARGRLAGLIPGDHRLKLVDEWYRE